MKRITISLILCILIGQLHAQNEDKRKDYYQSPQKFFWANGNLKEETNWKDGLINGYRKLYDINGEIQEEHFFAIDNSDNNAILRGEGKIRTYYTNGNIASEMDATQELSQTPQGYEYRITVEGKVIGHHNSNNHEKAYSFNIDIALCINKRSEDYYSTYNFIFNDVFLLYPERRFQGLNTQITYFHKDGTIKSKGDIKNGNKNGQWSFFHENGNIESKGKFVDKNKSYRIGKWTFLDENGTIVKEEEFYGGKNSKSLKLGALINEGKYYKNGNLDFVIQYPEIGDLEYYEDTIQKYFEANKLKYVYDKNNKLKIFNPVLNVENEFIYSGLYKEYSSTRQIKMIGYIGKRYYKKTENSNDRKRFCLDKNDKRIGLWYFFNEEGIITEVKKYNLCGNELSIEKPESIIKEQNKALKKTGDPEKLNLILQF